MTRDTWRNVLARKAATPRGTCKRRTVSGLRPTLVKLEDRLAPAVILWDGGPTGTGTNWQTAANWVGDILPGSGDDAQIDEAFAGVTITVTSSVTVNKVTSFASLEVTSGLLDIAAVSSAFNDFTLAGSALTGGGDLTVFGEFNWSSGVMSGSGKTIIPEGGHGDLSGPAVKLLGRTLENAGTLEYSGATFLFGPSAGAPGKLDNLAGGVFDITGGGNILQNNVNSEHEIKNAGVFRKTTNGATSTVGIPIDNSGSFDVQTGTVAVSAPFALGGSINVAGGALNLSGGGSAQGFFVLTAGAVNLTGGTFTLQNGTTGLGSGILILAGGALSVDSGSSASVLKLTQRRGTISGDGALTVTGAFTWAGGPMIGAGKTVVGAGATGMISGANSKFLGRTLENRGTLSYTGSGVRFGIAGGNGVISNMGGSVFNLNGDGDFDVSLGGSHLITNSGTMNRFGSGGTSIGAGITVLNMGAVNLNAGTLSITETYTQTLGTTTVTAGTTFSAIGGCVQSAGLIHLSGGTLAANVTLNGGSLQGFGAVDGNLVNNAQVNIGEIGDIGLLNVNGDYTQIANGSLILDLAGTGPGEFDKLIVAGTASLDGTVNIGITNGFFPSQGDSFQVMTFASVNGDFSEYHGLDLGDGLSLDPVFDPTSLTLVTV